MLVFDRVRIQHQWEVQAAFCCLSAALSALHLLFCGATVLLSKRCELTGCDLFCLEVNKKKKNKLMLIHCEFHVTEIISCRVHDYCHLHHHHH
jgi:hypothetical protein